MTTAGGGARKGKALERDSEKGSERSVPLLGGELKGGGEGGGGLEMSMAPSPLSSPARVVLHSVGCSGLVWFGQAAAEANSPHSAGFFVGN